MLRVGIVGMGFMGVTHLKAWGGVTGAKVTALVSGDPRKLSGDFSSVGGNLDTDDAPVDLTSIKCYFRFEQLLEDPEVDAIDLCLPTNLHRSRTERAIAAGKHVLVEKPMALSAREATEMCEIAKNHGRVLMVAQVLRYWPDYARAAQILRSGELGPIRLGSFGRRCGAPTWNPWLLDKAKSGGGVFDLLVHDFDFCVYLFGKPDAVSAYGIEKMEEGFDWLEARLYYPSGPEVNITGGWQPGDYPFSMEFSITGANGVLDFDSSVRRLTLYRKGSEDQEFQFDEQDGFRPELQDFADACLAGTPSPECPPGESALAVEVALAAIQSRSNDGVVTPIG